jgi:diadenosine tetraphosphatase ApaH/serine/threonine PP2A family protein phosphatase
MGAALVVCGHTHMQFDRVIGATRIINAGSVGMPFGRTGADWLLLGPDVQLRHTDYDLEAAAARFREKAGPRTEEFIVPAVLRPPSVDEILKAYSAAELSE